MNLKAYIQQATFSEGLPQGDIFLNLETIDLEDVKVNFDGKESIRTKLKSEGKEYFIPFSIVRDLKKLLEEGANKVRITRVGATKTDTRYTVVKI